MDYIEQKKKNTVPFALEFFFKLKKMTMRKLVKVLPGRESSVSSL